MTDSNSADPSSPPPSNNNIRKKGRPVRRSRTGCLICKQRRVRCDECRPICGHCSRLQLDCVYQKPNQRYSQAARLSLSQSYDNRESQTTDLNGRSAANDTAEISITSTQRNGGIPTPRSYDLGESDPLRAFSSHDHLANSALGVQESSRLLDPSLRIRYNQNNVYSNPWPDTRLDYQHDLFLNPAINRTFDAPDGQNSLGTFTFSDFGSQSVWPDYDTSRDQNDHPIAQNFDWVEPTVEHNTSTSPLSTIRHDSIAQAAAIEDTLQFSPGLELLHGGRSKYLLSYFMQVTQPPASILITGLKKWRRLQSYFIKMARQHKTVAIALFSLIELLAKDDMTHPRQDNFLHSNSMQPALTLRDAAQKEIESEVAKEAGNLEKSKDALLATIFLLAWFEIIRDQVVDETLFPGHLADRIIASGGKWNTYSKRLLTWLATLDSKASHLGNNHLLSPKSLEIVSKYRVHIITADFSDDQNSSDEEESVFSPEPHSSTSPTNPSHQGLDKSSPLFSSDPPAAISTRQMKQTVLNTLLQPALDWYLMTQTYCRRISSQDQQHRRRFTVKDECEVISACKQLEVELIHLWRRRPQIIRLSVEQLHTCGVSPDIASRLEEIFSLYKASFWVLFPYLHRVVWWHLPHSDIAKGAMEETWKNLQSSYGEDVQSTLSTSALSLSSPTMPSINHNNGINGIPASGRKKVVHPALLWPLFLFGSESDVPARRDWAMDQLEALGDSKTVVDEEGEEGPDSLPGFRLSIGATRNAKRAALLLRELVKRQEIKGARVDDRMLSMEMFGCHFSIV